MPVGLWESTLGRLNGNELFSILWGPVVLAVAKTQSLSGPPNNIDKKRLSYALRRVSEESLHFRANSSSDIVLKPFYEFQEKEPYFVYLLA
jgi:hypothetical protein